MTLHNQRTHGFAFVIAIDALDDPLVIIKEDFVDDNAKCATRQFGSLEGRLFVISHVYREVEGVETAWIISVKKAVKYEGTEYLDR